MRQLRILKQGVWYEIRTCINNREPLFRRYKALRMFARVFHETTMRFAFKIRRLRLENAMLTFYIRPQDGQELPAIMKWLKQTFAQRYNRQERRSGHIWGDRYWSRIVEGEQPEDEEWEGLNTKVRPYDEKNEEHPWFPLRFPFPMAPVPG